MKKFFVLLMTMSTVAFAEPECADLQGQFRGICTETAKDGTIQKFDMLYEVKQNKCDSVEIKMLTYPEQWSITHNFDLTQGLSVMEQGDYTTIYSGGYFLDSLFSGTVVFVHNGKAADTIYTQYEKVKKADGFHLLIDQTSLGYRMLCDLPVAEVL